jgi:PhnB protein
MPTPAVKRRTSSYLLRPAAAASSSRVTFRAMSSVVMLADEFPEHEAMSPASTGCISAVLYLQVEDVDAVWERALGGGAQVLRPLADTFWGEREGQLTDPFGHRWGLSQHVRDVSLAEMSQAAAQAFGGAASGNANP